jgi:hypothetical protein
MKNLSSLLVLFIIALTTFQSCSSSGDSSATNNLTQTPQAKSEYDQSNFGLYKGVLVGSSGIVIIDINNTNNTIVATLIIDNVTYNFSSNQTLQPNQNTTLNFVGGSNSFTFIVSGNGGNPTITNLSINGHPDAVIVVVKETSTILVKCFEGTYSGDDSGTFNAIIYGNLIKGLIGNASIEPYIADGVVQNNQISTSGTVTSGAIFTGTVNGNSCSGNWTNPEVSMSGTWSGVRTY